MRCEHKLVASYPYRVVHFTIFGYGEARARVNIQEVNTINPFVSEAKLSLHKLFEEHKLFGVCTHVSQPHFFKNFAYLFISLLIYISTSIKVSISEVFIYSTRFQYNIHYNHVYCTHIFLKIISFLNMLDRTMCSGDLCILVKRDVFIFTMDVTRIRMLSCR